MTTLRSRLLVAVVLAALALPVGAGVAFAAPGDLDPTFDGDGIAITNSPGNGGPARIVPLSDGRIVAAAACLGATSAQVFDFCVYRYNADGSLDTTFSGDGIAQSDFGNSFDTPWAMAVQSDGKVVVAGECGPNTSSTMCVARYNADGTPDTTFDGGGLVTTGGFTADGGDAAKGRAVVIQPDGMIVVAGFCVHNIPPNVFSAREACAARYTTTGALDSTFSGDGRVVVDLGGENEYVTTVGLQSTGKIVLGGTCSATSIGNFCLTRLTSTGTVDASFGVVATVVGTADTFISDVAISPTDQIIAGGSCALVSSYPRYLCLARYTATGALDTTFSGDGIATVLVGATNGGQASGSAVALQSNGKVLIANGCANPGFNDFCVARFNDDGTVDTGFGTNGMVLTPVNPTGNNDWATDVAVAANGKILLAGSCAEPMCIARYGGDPVTDTSAPDITITIDAADMEANTGWYNAATSGTNGVLVHVSAQDDTAVTHLTCTDGATTVLDTTTSSGTIVLADGLHSIACEASDGLNPTGAGSGSTAMPVGIDVDQVAPTVSCAVGTTLLLNEAVAQINLATVTDATSGTPIHDWFVSNPNTATPGLHNVGLSPEDEAGNVRNATCGYQVNYVFTGFAAPISSSSFGFVNALVGKVIPFRFTITDANGQPVNGITGASLADVVGSCSGTSRTFATSDYSKGKLGLFALGSGSYELRWKAPRTDRGTCRSISITLADGVAHPASIMFTR